MQRKAKPFVGHKGPEEGPWVLPVEKTAFHVLWLSNCSRNSRSSNISRGTEWPERASRVWNALMQAEGIKGFKGQEQSQLFVGGTAGNRQRCHWTGELWQDGKRPYLTAKQTPRRRPPGKLLNIRGSGPIQLF